VNAAAGCEGFADTDEDNKLFIPFYNIPFLGSQLTGYHPDVFAFLTLWSSDSFICPGFEACELRRNIKIIYAAV